MVGPLSNSETTRDGDLAGWQAFCHAYYETIAGVLRRLGMPEEEADELAHSFLIKVEEKRFLDTYRVFREREERAGRRSRFRNYLYRSLRNHVRDAYREQAARVRPFGPIPRGVADLEAAPEPRVDLDAIFALEILHRSIQALRRHCERTGKPHLWTFFEETILADEFRGRRGRTRAELIAASRCDPCFLDNSLTTAKRAFRRIVLEFLPRWPGDGLDPSERFTEWAAALRDSNASQFNLLHLAYRVAPYLDEEASQDASTEMVVGRATAPPAEAATVVSDDELKILLSFRLELPLCQMLDEAEIRRYVPRPEPSGPREHSPDFSPGPSAGTRPGRPLCLLSVIDPTEAEARALTEADVVGLLARLKSMAKQLRRRADHSIPFVFAEVIYTVTSVLAWVRHGAAIHSIGPGPLAANIRWLLEQPWLDDRLEPLLREGLAAIEGPSRLPPPGPGR